MASSQTKLGKLGVGTADPVDTLMRFIEFDPGVRREQANAKGTAGTFYTDVNLNREVRRTVYPSLSAEPTSLELAFLLAWSMGPAAANVYSPQVAVEARNLHWKPIAGEEIFLAGCGVDNMTLSANSGEILAVNLDIVGITHDDTRSNFPAVTPDVTSQPFVLSDLTATGGAFSFAGSTRQPNGVRISVQNFIDRTRHLNSLELTRVQKMDQMFTVAFEVPSGDNSGLWSAGMSSVTLNAEFKNINTGAELIVSCPCIRFPAQTPRHVPGGEGMVSIEGMCYRTGGAGHPIQFTLTQS